MADVKIEEIKRLRSLTGVGITDAKKALVEAGGDFDKALSEMRKKGLTKAEKRAEREARAGLIGTYSHDGRIGVVAEVNCETDFVAKTDEFKELVKDICLQVAASEADSVEALLKEAFNKKPEITIGELVKEYGAKLGENIVLRRFSRMVIGETS